MDQSSQNEVGQSSTSSPPSPPLPPRIKSRPDPLLVVCGCFSFVTAAASLLCVLVNALSAYQSFKNAKDIVGGIFRCYAVIIATFVAVAETEWSYIFKFWIIMKYLSGRGMLQIFVAVMTRAFPDVHGERQEIVLLQEISSYILLTCGVIYVISGIFCLGYLKRAHEKQAITRDQAIKNLEEIEKRRDELQALLLEEAP